MILGIIIGLTLAVLSVIAFFQILGGSTSVWLWPFYIIIITFFKIKYFIKNK